MIANARIQRRPHPESELEAGKLSPLLARIYALRDVTSADELDLSLGRLIPPHQLGGLDSAVALLEQAVRENTRITIVGDFDADGATSTTLAILALRAMGHHNVCYRVPNRFDYGYGLTPEIVALALQDEPGLIITVDNGVSSIDGVAAANAAGVPVLVTDHHLPGHSLPAAAAIVNPNLADNPFPSKATAGVGVIFYVMLGLRAQLRDTGWFEQRGIALPNMAELLDLVALGTVADVVPLDRNNRILVAQGLQRIRAGHCRPGIIALLEAAGRNHRQVQASDIGFAVGPRLNAAGRLQDMAEGIECLLTDDPLHAREIARQLDALNRERREIEDSMKREAEAMLDDSLPADSDQLPWGLCLSHADWHQGVIGILASRIKERHHRPVIAFAPAGGGELKGSARSIPGLHIRDVLDEVASSHPDLLQKFGGHAMAAGLSIRETDFAAFSSAFDQAVRRQLNEDQLHAVVHSDGAVEADELTLDTALAIRDGGPWGQAFPEPVFDDVFDVLSQRIVGEKHWKLQLCHQSGAPRVDAIAFNAVERFPQMPDRIHAAYHLYVNEWRGASNLQIRITHMTAHDE